MLHQPFDVDVGIVDVGADGVAAFPEVVGSHVGSHTYGDAGGAVEQKQRKLGGKNRGLFDGVIEVERHVHRILVDVRDDIFRHFLEFGLGVTHCSDRVAVHASEVALAVHQRITLVPPLGETRHCVVYGAVSVRMELTEHLAHDTGRFLRLPAVRQAEPVHPEKHPALHGLQTVADVRKSS